MTVVGHLFLFSLNDPCLKHFPPRYWFYSDSQSKTDNSAPQDTRRVNSHKEKIKVPCANIIDACLYKISRQSLKLNSLFSLLRSVSVSKLKPFITTAEVMKRFRNKHRRLVVSSSLSSTGNKQTITIDCSFSFTLSLEFVTSQRAHMTMAIR